MLTDEEKKQIKRNEVCVSCFQGSLACNLRVWGSPRRFLRIMSGETGRSFLSALMSSNSRSWRLRGRGGWGFSLRADTCHDKKRTECLNPSVVHTAVIACDLLMNHLSHPATSFYVHINALCPKVAKISDSTLFFVLLTGFRGGRDLMNSRIISCALFFNLGGMSPFTWNWKVKWGN